MDIVRSLVISFFLLLHLLSSGQCDENIISNPGFENVFPPCGPVPNNGLINGSFNRGCMDGWLGAWGTPSVCSADPYEGNYYACLGANNEAFYQNINLCPDATYSLRFHFQRLNSTAGSINVYLANGLTNQTLANTGTPPLTIDPSWQLVTTVAVADNNWDEEIVPSFTVSDPANQQLLFIKMPMGALDVGFDNIILQTLNEDAMNVNLNISCIENTGFSFTFSGVADNVPPGMILSSYMWDFGDGQTASGNIVSHTFVAQGLYEVCLSAIDQCGCLYSDCFTLDLNECWCECGIDNQPPVVMNVPMSFVEVDCPEDIPLVMDLIVIDCDTNPIIGFSELISGPPCDQTIQREWVVGDHCGNETLLTQTIIVSDSTAPVFLAQPLNLEFDCVEADTPTVQAWLDSHGGALAIDDCSDGIWSYQVHGSFDQDSVLATFYVTDFCDNTDSINAWIIQQHHSDTIFTTTSICGTFSAYQDTMVIQHGICEEVLIETVLPSPADTTHEDRFVCAQVLVGTDTIFLQNSSGCDSLHIVQSSYVATDTMFLDEVTCDESAAGIFTELHLDQNGCDSTVVTTTRYTAPDTLETVLFVCSGPDTLLFEQILTNQFGCDSILERMIFINVNPEIVNITQYTCDIAEAGINLDTFPGSVCDTIVAIETIYVPVFVTEELVVVCSFSGPSTDTIYFTSSGGCDSLVVHHFEYRAFSTLTEVNDASCAESMDGFVQIESVVGGDPPYLSSIDGGLFTSDTLYDMLSPGAHVLVVKDANDCRDTIPFEIGLDPILEIDAGVDIITSIGNSIQLAVMPDSLNADYLWTAFDPLSCPDCPQSLLGPVTKEQMVFVSVISEDGCAAYDSLWIRLEEDHHFYIPNSFSPNGDGINDYFFLSSSLLDDGRYTMTIFDRWGGIMFHREGMEPNVMEQGWNGQNQNEQLQSGVYVYKIQLRYRIDEEEIYAGDLTLIR